MVDALERVVEVLQDVHEQDDVVALGVLEALERDLVDLEAEPVTGVAGGGPRQLQAHGVVAAPAGLVEEQPVSAAHVQQASARHERGDVVEQPRRGRAPAGLLAEVLLVGHVAVELDELVVAGQLGLLDRAAVRAREEVAVAARLVLGGRQGVRRQGGEPAGDRRAEVPEADATREVEGHGLCI